MSPTWVYVWTAAVAGFVAALVTALITSYVALYVRTYGAGRRLIEASAGREAAEQREIEYGEAILAWRHYAQAVEQQLADAHASINHLSGRHRGADPDTDDVVVVLPAGEEIPS